MKIHKFVSSPIAALVLAASGAATPAQLQASEMQCTSFEVVSKDWRRGVHPPGDPVVGMKRAGTRRLFDDKGNEIGLYTYAGTVVDVFDGGETIMNITRTWSFKDGTIAGVGMIAHPDVMNVDVQPDLVASVVTGGTGAFRQAHGSVEMLEPNADGSRPVRFDIGCD